MKNFFRRYINPSSASGAPASSSEPKLEDLFYTVRIICRAYSMPKTAITVLAFISNPLTKKHDIEELCKQIRVAYDGHDKVAEIVSEAVKRVYEECAVEEKAATIYKTVEDMAKANGLGLDEPLFVDMLQCKADPIGAQNKRRLYRQPSFEKAITE